MPWRFRLVDLFKMLDERARFLNPCAVDVTGLNVNEGDEVIVFGPRLPVTELADALETIPYEVLTSVSRRVKRIYYQE
ncbi:MAG: alanine racemase C-terminal domain-containing protein [Phycisphaerae bacterium]